MPGKLVGTLRKNVTFKGDSTGRSIASQRNQQDSDEDIADADWVKKIHDKEANKKLVALKKEQNIVEYNYGVMQDFFAYSATCV